MLLVTITHPSNFVNIYDIGDILSLAVGLRGPVQRTIVGTFRTPGGGDSATSYIQLDTWDDNGLDANALARALEALFAALKVEGLRVAILTEPDNDPGPPGHSVIQSTKTASQRSAS